MGADALIPPDVMNAAAPKRDAPAAVQELSIPLNRPAQRGPDEAAERPPKGGEHHKRFLLTSNALINPFFCQSFFVREMQPHAFRSLQVSV